jgi:hypothetical protein
MCNKCFQGLMCVDEQAQYQKHLAAFASLTSSSRANATSARPGARPRQQRGRGVVFSNGVVIQTGEGGLLPSKPKVDLQQAPAAKDAPPPPPATTQTAAAADATATKRPPVLPL